MASAYGIVQYWNGVSGWIKPVVSANTPTAYSTDILIMSAGIQSGSGSVVRGGTASNSLQATNDPGLLGGTATYSVFDTQQGVAQQLVVTLS